jgi:hypothetical protein
MSLDGVDLHRIEQGTALLLWKPGNYVNRCLLRKLISTIHSSRFELKCADITASALGPQHATLIARGAVCVVG